MFVLCSSTNFGSWWLYFKIPKIKGPVESFVKEAISHLVNQSGALLLSVGDHDLTCISVLFTLNASVTCPTFSHFVSPSNIFSSCFPPAAISFDRSSCHKMFHFLLITWPKKTCVEFLYSIEN